MKPDNQRMHASCNDVFSSTSPVTFLPKTISLRGSPRDCGKCVATEIAWVSRGCFERVMQAYRERARKRNKTNASARALVPEIPSFSPC